MDACSPHPTDRTLRAYGLGWLDDVPAESVHAHLGGCPECRRLAAVLSWDGLSILRLARDDSSDPRSAHPGPPSPPGRFEHPDYEVHLENRCGGLGTVYLAWNRRAGRLETLKVLPPDLADRRAVVPRFLAIARHAARFRHPNLVRAYSVFRAGAGLVLALEFLDGLDLAGLARSRGPFPVPIACDFIHQAALGLQSLHEIGLVHREITPANLLLVRVGDRAVVKLLASDLTLDTAEGEDGRSHEGPLAGNAAAMAPEQIRDPRRVDIRADIYSLGCTLYFFLAGKRPFEAGTLREVFQAHLSAEATPLDQVRRGVPARLAAVVARMMARVPGERFQQPYEVARALRPFFE